MHVEQVEREVFTKASAHETWIAEFVEKKEARAVRKVVVDVPSPQFDWARVVLERQLDGTKKSVTVTRKSAQQVRDRLDELVDLRLTEVCPKTEHTVLLRVKAQLGNGDEVGRVEVDADSAIGSKIAVMMTWIERICATQDLERMSPPGGIGIDGRSHVSTCDK